MRHRVQPPAVDVGHRVERRVGEIARIGHVAGAHRGAGDAVRAREIHQLALKPGRHLRYVPGRPVRCGRQARQLYVGPLIRRQRVVQGLVADHLGVQCPDVVAMRDADAAWQEGRAGALGA